MAFGLIEARILGLLISSFFLGVHLTTTCVCVWAILVWNPARGRRVHWGFLAATLMMAIIGTVDVSTDGVTNVRVWTTGNLKLFTDETVWMNLTKNVDISLRLLIGDAVLIYRCWIVYERKWLAVIPSLLVWLGNVTASIILIVRSADAVGISSGINAPSLVPWTTAELALTVALNTITCSLIVFRIWTVSRSVRSIVAGPDRLLYAMRVLVESGGFYVLSATITLITVLTRSAAVYITANSLCQITAICFNLIIIRFDRNLANKSQIATMSASRSIPMNSLNQGSRAKSSTTPQRFVEIEVQRATATDAESLSVNSKAGEL
ncbi:hypothetical protein CERSUDRAFT_116231 [Gelatoporia subvermispora B]|uniref:Transmembrane protein n=1 Tax=Ceriporiopsis subvermispora (strain B) TaxID=914234 RepID=M2R9Q1_CERS8|nr:hypothetical protein CERSUDRAFT_116231 [Gelatoporia subvermispora B]